jgi:hypothetical protein
MIGLAPGQIRGPEAAGLETAGLAQGSARWSNV